jgi:NAD(P)-dependent dehydrogenase (short-subunit alcohol dehydrogenase family)
MVNDVRSKRRIVIVGVASALGRRLRETYAGDGHEIIAVELTGSLEEAAVACGAEPIDRLIFADDRDLDAPISTAGRPDMQDALYRLTFAPFRLATLLRPAVAAAKGCVVLYSRTASLMERQPDNGRFIDRPFRAAAHALWKCLEVEWRDDDIRLRIVAVRDPDAPEPGATAACRDAGAASLLVDQSGKPLPW